MTENETKIKAETEDGTLMDKLKVPEGMLAVKPKNVVGLDFENNALVLLVGNFDNDSSGEIIKIADKNGEVTSQLFPHLSIFEDGKTYLVDASHQYRLPVNPDDDIGKILVSKEDRAKLYATVKIADRVPEKYKNEYCIMKGKTLLFHTTNEQEALLNMKSDLFKNIPVELYMPHQ